MAFKAATYLFHSKPIVGVPITLSTGILVSTGSREKLLCEFHLQILVNRIIPITRKLKIISEFQIEKSLINYTQNHFLWAYSVNE